MDQYGVKGDPEGMRRLARALKKDADQLRDGKKDAKSAFNEHNSEGPIVKSWKRRLDPALARLPAHAARLDDIADSLIKGARQVEVDIERARVAEQQRIAREEAARRERAKP